MDIEDAIWLLNGTLLLIGIVVLCIVSPKARLIVGLIQLVVGTLLRIGVSSGYHEDEDWPPPWRHRRF